MSVERQGGESGSQRGTKKRLGRSVLVGRVRVEQDVSAQTVDTKVVVCFIARAFFMEFPPWCPAFSSWLLGQSLDRNDFEREEINNTSCLLLRLTFTKSVLSELSGGMKRFLPNVYGTVFLTSSSAGDLSACGHRASTCSITCPTCGMPCQPFHVAHACVHHVLLSLVVHRSLFS